MLQDQLTKFEPGARINLYEIDATRLGGGISRFTDAGANVLFGGLVYVAIQVESSGWEYSTTGALPRPVIRISNVTKIGSALVISMDDLKGALITRKRTLARYLDDGIEPNPGAIINPIDIYLVEQKLSQNKFEISWQLSSMNDQERVKLPFRQVFRTCQYIYRFYDSTAEADDPFSYERVTCPYAGEQFFTKQGESTDDPTKDQCGRRVSDCKLRFGENAVLPFGGFPGVARVRL